MSNAAHLFAIGPDLTQALANSFAPDAIMLRTCDKDGRAHAGFQWPLTRGEMVVAPDWDPAPVCGGGLHGLIGGLGDWGLLNESADAKWLLCAIMRSEAVAIGDEKIKVPRCRVDFIGSRAEVLSRIPETMFTEISFTVKGATKDSEKSETTVATTGDDSAAATTGDGSAAATTGPNSIAAALGPNARAKSATAIILSRYDGGWNVTHVFASMVDGAAIKSGVWYELDENGAPVECAEQDQ